MKEEMLKISEKENQIVGKIYKHYKILYILYILDII
jgi:hypothetical protein